jgi:hypothetical protein
MPKVPENGFKKGGGEKQEKTDTARERRGNR